MATFVIGDVQGCFVAMMQLIKTIRFNPAEDQLIFCGDLVNRGGRSLDVLRWVYAHQRSCDSVLGNHDLSLLSKYYSKDAKVSNIEFKEVVSAPDASLLMNWLLNRPLYIQKNQYLIVHAGIYPSWSVKKFKQLATETKQAMMSDPLHFFANMYGNKPKNWSDELADIDTNRFVINASTRMRFVRQDGALNFTENGRTTHLKSLKPWFTFNDTDKLKKHIIFGHWSALGLHQDANVTGLDTGKVWGGQLTAMRLEDRQLFSV